MEKIKCERCGHKWFPRTRMPVECSNCKSRKWNQKKENNQTGLKK